MKYKAFISYRHCVPDSLAAEKIIKAIENYGIPKTIIEKHHTDKHVGRLFRDEEELAAADNLSVAITDALDESEYLIMVCSPRYLNSEWCMLEIQHWINRNGRKNIITVLLEGEPEDSFPKVLTDYEENGIMIHTEPLAVDIRGESEKEILKNIDIQKFRIISSLIGCNYDDLRQRQQEREKKNTAAAIALTSFVLAIIFGVVITANAKLSNQRDLIAMQYDELEQKNKEINEANQNMSNANKELSEQKDLIAQQYAELEKKNDEISEANNELEQKNREISDANNQLEQKSNEISEANDELEQKNKEISDANSQLEQKNKEISDVNGQLGQKNKEISEANSELEQKNREISEANKNILAANAEAYSKLAESENLFGNKLLAVQAAYKAYNSAKSAGVDYWKYYNALLKYSNIYETSPTEKLVSHSFDDSITAPYYYSITANERYFIVSNSERTLYGYDVISDEMIFYKKLDSSAYKIIMLDGAKYAMINKEVVYDPGNSYYYTEITVIDMISREEHSYTCKGEAVDAVFSDGELRILLKPYDSDEMGTLIRLDTDCNYIGSFATAERPLQILDNKNVLCKNFVYNLETGRMTAADTSGYNGSSGNNKTIYLDYESSEDDKKYHYKNNSAQYSTAVLIDGSLIYNTYDYYAEGNNIINGTNSKQFFEDNSNTNLRFAADPDTGLIAYTDEKGNICISDTVKEADIVVRRESDTPIRKLILSGDKLFVIFYENETVVVTFNKQTMALDKCYKLDYIYFDAVIGGSFLNMMRIDYEQKKLVTDTFLINDLGGYTEIKISESEMNELSSVNRFFGDYSISDTVPMVANLCDSDDRAEYYFFDAENGRFVSHYTSFAETVFHNLSIINSIGNGIFYGTYNKDIWILNNYREYIHSFKPYADIEKDIVYIKKENSNYFFANDNIFLVKELNDNTFCGRVYDIKTGKLRKKITFLTEQTGQDSVYGNVRWFYDKDNIRVEATSNDVYVYNNEKLVYSCHMSDSSTYSPVIPYQNSDIMAFTVETRVLLYSFSRNEVVFDKDCEGKGLQNYAVEESCGKNYLLLGGRYLIDTKTFEEVHDFGLNMDISSYSSFYYNEYLDMWGIVGFDGTLNDVTFFDAKTFEEVFTLNKAHVLSPNGKYVYRFAVSSNGRVFWRIPLMNEEETIKKIEEKYDSFVLFDE